MQSMRKRIINERRDELKELSRNEFVNHIRNYPDQRSLDIDGDGNKRDHQVGLMAKVIGDRLSEDDKYEMSDRQYFTMIDNFTKVTVPDMKVVGVSFRDPDVSEFKKDLVGEKKNGQVKFYDIDYHLENEPDNPYDKNAVKVSVENVNGELDQIGYLQKEFVEKYEVEDQVIQGLMVDHSNGNFKNVSYNIALDTESLEVKPYDKDNTKAEHIELTSDDLLDLDDVDVDMRL